MADHPWVKEFPGAMTVCDREGIIIELNDKAAEAYQDRDGQYGGFVELALEVPARTPHFIRDRGPESS